MQMKLSTLDQVQEHRHDLKKFSDALDDLNSGGQVRVTVAYHTFNDADFLEKITKAVRAELESEILFSREALIQLGVDPDA